MEDTAIIHLLFQRDEKGLNALSEKYGSEMKSIAYQVCRSREDAEEACNDALLGVWNAIPPERPRILSSYVYRIVRNQAYKIVRKANAEKRGEALSMDRILEELGDVFEAEDSGSDSRQITDALNRFIDLCSAEDRILFLRRYFYYDSISAIAAREHATEGAITMRLSRLRAELKKHLIKEGIYL